MFPYQTILVVDPLSALYTPNSVSSLGPPDGHIIHREWSAVVFHRWNRRIQILAQLCCSKSFCPRLDSVRKSLIKCVQDRLWDISAVASGVRRLLSIAAEKHVAPQRSEVAWLRHAAGVDSRARRRHRGLMSGLYQTLSQLPPSRPTLRRIHPMRGFFVDSRRTPLPGLRCPGHFLSHPPADGQQARCTYPPAFNRDAPST